MKAVTIELPPELVKLLPLEQEAKRGAKVALVLDLVRRGAISRAKAAPLAELPALLAEYRIPWFDYSVEDAERDRQTLRGTEAPGG